MRLTGSRLPIKLDTICEKGFQVPGQRQGPATVSGRRGITAAPQEHLGSLPWYHFPTGAQQAGAQAKHDGPAGLRSKHQSLGQAQVAGICRARPREEGGSGWSPLSPGLRTGLYSEVRQVRPPEAYQQVGTLGLRNDQRYQRSSMVEDAGGPASTQGKDLLNTLLNPQTFG